MCWRCVVWAEQIMAKNNKYLKIAIAIRNVKKAVKRGEFQKHIASDEWEDFDWWLKYLLDEVAYAFESDPKFDEKNLRKLVYGKDKHPNLKFLRPEVILKKLLALKKEALKDCWDYHGDLINENEENKVKKADLLDFLYDVDLRDWEDVGFFVGYLRGLDDGIELVEPQEEDNN